jgi:uncharacterized LabA/DUF88 family protein
MLKSSPLIIVSMHRSGSSLVASLLQSAGLQIGERLAEAKDNNVRVFFENLDFVEFHRDLLGSQGLNQDGWTREKKIKVDDLFTDRAKQLIAQNSTDTYWGWKDPRTTLFLKFWAELLPEAKFLLIFRSPWEVVDSLYRCGDPFFQAEPELAVKMWLHYNKKILKFINSSSHRCLLANIKTISDDPETWIEAINQKFQTHLNVPNLDICEPSLLQSQSINSRRSTLIDQYFPKATILYKALNAQAWYPNHKTFVEQQSDLVSTERLAFTDWRNLRILEMQNHNLEAQVQQTQTALEQSQTRLRETASALEQSQVQLHETEMVLEQSQVQLHETEAVLEQSQAQLHKTEAFLEQSQTQLCETEVVLEQSQAQLHETETVLERSQAQLISTEEALEQLQAQLKHTSEELEQSNATNQKLLDRLAKLKKSQLDPLISNEANETGYKALVWYAWQAYLDGDLVEMTENLQRSAKLSSLAGTENILSWLDKFTEFSKAQGNEFNTYELTNTSEWQTLVRRVSASKAHHPNRTYAKALH